MDNLKLKLNSITKKNQNVYQLRFFLSKFISEQLGTHFDTDITCFSHISKAVVNIWLNGGQLQGQSRDQSVGVSLSVDELSVWC